MAMPRPSGKAQKLAERVVPGLQKGKKSSKNFSGGSSASDGFMSEVEIKETENIEKKEGLKRKKTGSSKW
jgi:hypothetical protein